MSKIILARHGQSVLGAEDRIAGKTDCPLTDQGVQEGWALRDIILGQHFPIKAVFSSQLNRAFYTAVPTAVACRLLIGLVKELNERDYGILEGKLHSDIPILAKTWKEISGLKHVFEACGLELFPDFYDRGKRAYQILKQKQVEANGNIVAFCHGGTIRMMRAVHEGIGWEESLYRFGRVETGSIVVLEV
jgi:2,3-bisphosphoglycerate-dependent phosphoglycerate mutase